MTSPFPTLLRRSSFATYDPLITRVYTSPSPAAGDWGNKYSTPLPRGPRYVKLANLDAGKAVRSDYTSGESEARWLQAWGSGKVRWDRKDFFPPPSGSGGGSPSGQGSEYYRDILRTPSASSSSTSPSPATAPGGSSAPSHPRSAEMWMDDIEAMTPREFELYLERVRSSRPSWRKAKLANLTATAKSRLSAPEDLTLGYVNMAGHASDVDGANLQTSLAHDSLSSPSSTRLLSRTHRLAGLAYSQGPASGHSGDTRRAAPRFSHPVYTFPGRALDKASAEQKVTQSQYVRHRPGSHFTAWPLIVSAGGQIGVSAQSTARVADSSRASGGSTHVSPVDYTRAKPTAGEARWSVGKATLEKPPTVVGLGDSDAVSRWWARDTFARRISAAARPRPMDTMALKVEFDLAPGGSASDSEGGGAMADVGRGEWVAQGLPTDPLTEGESFGAQRGVGGVLDRMEGKYPPRQRSYSWNKGQRAALAGEARAESNQRLKGIMRGIVARHGEATAAGAGGDPAGEAREGQAGARRAHRGGPRAARPAPGTTPRM